VHQSLLLVLCCLIISCVLLSCKGEEVKEIAGADPKLEIRDSTYYYSGALLTAKIITQNPLTSPIAKAVFYVRDGKLDGSYKEWLVDGTLRLFKNYKAGKEEGQQEGYHTDGQLSYQYNAVSGKRHGDYREYYPDGNLQVQKSYVEGIVTAEKIFDISGVTLANYVIKGDRLYGFRGSSSCINVLYEDAIKN